MRRQTITMLRMLQSLMVLSSLQCLCLALVFTETQGNSCSDLRGSCVHGDQTCHGLDLGIRDCGKGQRCCQSQAQQNPDFSNSDSRGSRINMDTAIGIAKGDCLNLFDPTNCKRNITMGAIKYYLWTRTNQEDGQLHQLVPNSEASLQSSPFDGARSTYFLYHGWPQTGLDQWVLQAKTELLTKFDANVISVDWAETANRLNYFQYVKNAPLVGERTASVIAWLQSERGLQAAQTFMVGFSTGAQMAGFTGKVINQKYSSLGKIARITGLDPAGPLFFGVPAEERLDKGDATFVDVIHANGGDPIPVILSIPVGQFGLLDTIGHIDFYPNGGERQPGCSRLSDAKMCSHSRAIMYWLETINPKAGQNEFVSWPAVGDCGTYDEFLQGKCTTCDPSGCPVMGFNSQQLSSYLSAKYFLKTNSASPFARGEEQ